MRFLIKLLMKIHIKIWTWFDLWGERCVIAPAAHFSNAFCNSMDKPRTLMPFLLGSLAARDLTKPEGGSWVPILWRLAFWLFFVIMFIDLFVAIFALLYKLLIVVIITPLILAPMVLNRKWDSPKKMGNEYGVIVNPYLREIWYEVDTEHDLYKANNLYYTIQLFDA